MNGSINLYGRARRIALLRNIAIIVGCIIGLVILIRIIFTGTNTEAVISEYEKLRNYFVDRGFSCEMLNTNGSKCISSTDNVKTTFYRYDNGFEYVVKTNSYSLYLVHRLDKEDKIEFVTFADAFAGYRNQKFICGFEKSAVSSLTDCISEKDNIKLDVKSYLGVIEHAQTEITNAVNYSGFSLEHLLINYEWNKK